MEGLFEKRVAKFTNNGFFMFFESSKKAISKDPRYCRLCQVSIWQLAAILLPISCNSVQSSSNFHLFRGAQYVTGGDREIHTWCSKCRWHKSRGKASGRPTAFKIALQKQTTQRKLLVAGSFFSCPLQQPFPCCCLRSVAKIWPCVIRR